MHSLDGRISSVDPTWVIPFEVTEEQARRWAKDQLGHALDELKAGIDDTLAGWRQQLDDFDKRPLTDATSVTPNAASAFLDFLKALPSVVGQSISGDEQRVAAAKVAMAALQRRLKDAGIDVDDRVMDFPERLASLRTEPDAE